MKIYYFNLTRFPGHSRILYCRLGFVLLCHHHLGHILGSQDCYTLSDTHTHAHTRTLFFFFFLGQTGRTLLFLTSKNLLENNIF